jgi:hypothetical protein
MEELTGFEKIAPFLKHPLVLAGFVVFLFVMLLQSLIKSGIIPPLTKKSGADITKEIFSYVKLISILVIVLGFSLEFFKESRKSESFDFTVFLENVDGETVLKNQGKLVLRIVNDKREENIDAKGSANFKQIPPKARKQSTILQLQGAEGWQFNNGKKAIELTLEGTSTTIILEPDNSLCCISGSVSDENAFLSGVRVSIDDIIAETDENGRFFLEIPNAKRKAQYTLTAYKEGYNIWDNFVYPASSPEVKIILHKK